MRLSIPAPFVSPLQRVHRFVPLAAAESLFITLFALVISLVLFGMFVMFAGANPLSVFHSMYVGSFGTSFSIQNTLARAAPLMLTGLCVALPLRLGMVIIGGEGALALGGLTAAVIGHAMNGSKPFVVIACMMLGACAVGGLWIVIAGALKQYRGVNETISSLLLNYLAIAIFRHLVEGPLYDPEMANIRSTFPIGEANMLGSFMGLDVHWGFGFGLVACILCYILMNHSVIGFAANVVGGNARAAKLAGISIARLTLLVCFLAGAAAGLTGMVEVAAVQGRANDNIICGYGYAGILVAFLARGNPLAIIPVALLLGGVQASGGVIQRREHLSDACVAVFQGIIFLTILASETSYGRYKIFQRKEA
jgi:simple sugar transport system permease protein